MSGAQFYVYALCQPSGDAFYFGKGSRDRIAQHEREARAGTPGAKCDAIRAIWAAGGEVTRIVLLRTDDEAAACRLEHQLITAAAAHALGTNMRLTRQGPREPAPVMTGQELSEALAELDWSAAALGRRIKRSRQFVQQLRDDGRPVPSWIAQYVLGARRIMASVPAPIDPDTASATEAA